MENTNGQAPQGAYGYSEHKPKENSFIFGLNPKVKISKFKHTMNGGKDGAELECLEIVFNINGTEKNYKRFPVTKAFAKDDQGNQIEVTDPNHQAMVAERQMLSATLLHIVGCFVERDVYKQALEAQPIQSFKHFCEILAGLLPKGFEEVELDLFGQYQWTISGDNKVTYIDIPKNMKHGRWISKHIEPVGKWEKQVKPNADSNEVALRYVDADGHVHPFKRNGWYMDSNFAHQQKEAPSAGSQAMAASSQASSDEW